MVLLLWFWLALSASIMWAAVNVIDKYVISGFFRRPAAQLVVSGLVQLLVSIIVVAFLGLEISTVQVLLLGAFSGVVSFVATIFYFKALVSAEVSRAIAIVHLIPLWVMFLAIGFLGEQLSLMQQLGIVLLVAGAVMISVKKGIKWGFGAGSGLMLVASFLYACESVILKFVTGYMSFWSIYFWASLGFVSGSICVLLARRGTFAEIRRFRKASLLAVSSEAIASVAAIVFLWSMSIGLVSLASGVTSVQPLFVLLFAALLSLFWPRIIKEELKASVLGLKVVAILLIVAGSILIM